MLQQFLRFAAIAFLAWCLLAYLGGWWWPLPWVVVTVAGINAITAWMIRCHRDWLVSACEYRLVLSYIRVVCYLTGDDIPTVENAGSRGVLLRSKADYAQAAKKAKRVVRGHNDVIEGVLASIYEHQQLRATRRNRASKGPLTSLLLVGGEGVGKVYVARVLAKLLYSDQGIHVIDCRHSTVDGAVATLAEVATSSGLGLVCFEGIESANANLQILMDTILRKGVVIVPGDDDPVSFENAVVVMTTDVAIESVSALGSQNLVLNQWKRKAIDVVCRESSIDAQLLAAVSEVHFCRTPIGRMKAEVTAMLMINECKDHGVDLVYVDPTILAAEVSQWNDAIGFRGLPNRIQELLRKPLVAATQQKQTKLSLVVSENNE